ncbi:MAG: hypothetical protein ACN6OP_18505 [Pseudomonadales bacterium]
MRKKIAFAAVIFLIASFGVAILSASIIREDNSPDHAHQAEKSEVDLFSIAGIDPTKEKSKPVYLDRNSLNYITRWRYDKCLNDASDKPTEQGVHLAIYVCDERFLRQDSTAHP